MSNTLELRVERAWKKPSYTIGKFFVDGKRFCESLEDRDCGLTSAMTEADVKNRKVYGETAIPTGRYRVKLTYSNKFKRILPEVFGVKGFEGIRIHSGNTAKDSLGCLLLGENKATGKVLNSRATMQKLMAILDNTTKEIWLTIV